MAPVSFVTVTARRWGTEGPDGGLGGEVVELGAAFDVRLVENVAFRIRNWGCGCLRVGRKAGRRREMASRGLYVVAILTVLCGR